MNEIKKERILIVIPRGEAIKNFIYSGIIYELGEKFDLHIFTVNPDKELTKSLRLSQYNVNFFHEEQPIPKFIQILRFFIRSAHDIKLGTKAGFDRLNRIKFNYLEKNKWIFWKLLYLILLILSNKYLLNILIMFEELIWKSFYQDKSYVNIINDIKPVLCFNTSHIHNQVSLPLIYVLKSFKIPIVSFIFSWDNLTSQGRIIPTSNYYFVWNREIKNQLLSIYNSVNSEKIFITGTPQFDFHYNEKIFFSKEEFCEKNKLELDKKIILYTTSMPYHTPNEELVIEEIANIIKEKRLNAQLFVRVYPKDDSNRFCYLMKNRDDIIFQKTEWVSKDLTPTFNDVKMWSNTLKYIDIGINVASTVSIELCIFDKPVINIGFTPEGVKNKVVLYSNYYKFDHFKPIVESNAVDVVYKRSDLEKSLVDYLKNPSNKSLERKQLIDKFFDKEFGTSSYRIINSINSIVGSIECLTH